MVAFNHHLIGNLVPSLEPDDEAIFKETCSVKDRGGYLAILVTPEMPKNGIKCHD
jgi:hypothetical protein